MNFAKRHLVVTGGTGILGTAAVGRLLELGATCHMPNFNTDELNGTGEFLAMMSTNTLSCYLCCHAALENMRRGRKPSGRSNGGRIVNVAARPALEPRTGAGMVLYTAAKAAVAAITQSLAEEVAAEGIWVNAIAPSTLNTPINRMAMPEAEHKNWVTVGEVAETVTFLASPENTATRGAIVTVYGKS